MAKQPRSSSNLKPAPALNAPVAGNLVPPVVQRPRMMDAVEAAKIASAAESEARAVEAITGLQPLTSPEPTPPTAAEAIRAQFVAPLGALPEDTGAVRGCSALYRVATARQVRLGGNTQTFKVGRMFDTALYPPGTLANLLEQGLHLELVREAVSPKE